MKLPDNHFAVASFWSGLISWICFLGIALGPAAVALGVMALLTGKDRSTRLHAIFGMSIGIGAFVIQLAAVLHFTGVIEIPILTEKFVMPTR